jgi:hypothetical protein
MERWNLEADYFTALAGGRAHGTTRARGAFGGAPGGEVAAFEAVEEDDCRVLPGRFGVEVVEAGGDLDLVLLPVAVASGKSTRCLGHYDRPGGLVTRSKRGAVGGGVWK